MDNKTRILLVDDESAITTNLAPFLERSGFAVNTAADGEDALRQVASFTPHLVIMDVLMPVLDGREALRRLRKGGNTTPVILLTQVGESTERAMALEEGADDYLNKPFDPHELVARIRAVLRRVEARAGEPERQTLGVDDVSLDPAARTVRRDGEPVEVTTVEFDILRARLESAGQTVAREAIAEKVLGRRFDPFDRSVDMHISKLRRKLGERPGGDERIKTIRGVGYIYTLPAARR